MYALCLSQIRRETLGGEIFEMEIILGGINQNWNFLHN